MVQHAGNADGDSSLLPLYQQGLDLAPTYRSLLGGAEAWMCFGFRVEVNPFIYPHYKEGVDTPVETRVDSRQINADLNSRLSLLRCVCVETIKVER